MSKLPIYTQVILAFIALNIILIVLGQPLILINDVVDPELRMNVTRVVATIGIFSLAAFYISNQKSNA